MSTPKRRFFEVRVTQVDLAEETEFDLQILRVTNGGRERVLVFPYSQGDSPRCDSLDALGDVVRDEITAVVWNIQNEGAS